MARPLARLTCPICDSTERMELYGPLKLWTNISRSAVTVNSSSMHGAAGTVCPNCQNPFGILIDSTSLTIHQIFQASTPDSTDAALQGSYVTTIPNSEVSGNNYPNLPDLISQNFVFILEDAQRRRNPAGIMSGARSCLDVALKALGQVDGGRRNRINNLAQQGLITNAIAAWAQTLWEEGSDATHDLQANLERAIEHVDFLKLFFEVAFEMPARVATSSHGAIPAVVTDPT